MFSDIMSKSTSEEGMPELEPVSDGSISVSSELHVGEPSAPLRPQVECCAAPLRGSGVSFSTLSIREYGIVPGDNPSVSFGCPLALGWEYDNELIVSVEDYEESKPASRAMFELRMPSSYREEKLRCCGFSRSEIQEGVKMAMVGRKQRQRSLETLHLASVEELVEKAKRMVFGGGRKRKEKELMKKSSLVKSLLSEEVAFKPSLKHQMESSPARKCSMTSSCEEASSLLSLEAR